LYRSSLNFYRALSKTDRFPLLPGYPAGPLPSDKPVYVLYEPSYRAFMDKRKLVVVYRGRMTDVVVAVPPDGPVPIDKTTYAQSDCNSRLADIRLQEEGS
jgi:hypothetical protein